MKYVHHKKYASLQCYFQKLFNIYLIIFREKKMCRVWNEFISKEIEIIPKDIWTKIIWRGQNISFFVSGDKFKFDTKPNPFTKSSLSEKWLKLNTLLGNYEICFGKRKQVPFGIKVYSALKKWKTRK
jgi:hypothetical protein